MRLEGAIYRSCDTTPRTVMQVSMLAYTATRRRRMTTTCLIGWILLADAQRAEVVGVPEVIADLAVLERHGT
jgi:hypothetical protein